MADSSLSSYEQVRHLVTQMIMDLESEQLQPLNVNYAQLQHLFQAAILGRDLELYQPPQVKKLQSIHTEMNRDLRLLGTDLMFLSTARNLNTITQRKRQIGDRLFRLIQFCDVVLNPDATPLTSEDR